MFKDLRISLLDVLRNGLHAFSTLTVVGIYRQQPVSEIHVRLTERAEWDKREDILPMGVLGCEDGPLGLHRTEEFHSLVLLIVQTWDSPVSWRTRTSWIMWDKSTELMCENLLLCFHDRSIYLYHLVKTQSSGMMKASETVNKGDLIVKREHNTVNFCERNYDVRLLLPSDLSKKSITFVLLSFQSYKSLSTIFCHKKSTSANRNGWILLFIRFTW